MRSMRIVAVGEEETASLPPYCAMNGMPRMIPLDSLRGLDGRSFDDLQGRG
jgi:hypothetical protein